MSGQANKCKTNIPRRGPGRPKLPGKTVTYSVRLRAGKHDEIIARVEKVPRGKRGAYFRRLLEGLTVEVLDAALVEDQETTDGLDSMWDLDDDGWEVNPPTGSG